jgi:hypothetical protein
MTYRAHHPRLHQEEDLVPAWKVLTAIAVTLVLSAFMVVWAVSANAAHMAALRPSGVFPEQWLGPRHMVGRVREDVFGEQRGVSFNAAKRAELESWGWVDPERRIVRIPVAQAIDLLLSGRQP